mmetsp:Transcript_23884/g.59748  ORF Transcript_23884/g.59748 Transcript_23884/m.59748 type:complete len:216 (+) Transcript_23884:1985-2632(+)
MRFVGGLKEMGIGGGDELEKVTPLNAERGTTRIGHIFDAKRVQRFHKVHFELFGVASGFAHHQEVVEEIENTFTALTTTRDELRFALKDESTMWYGKLHFIQEIFLYLNHLVDVLALLGSLHCMRRSIAHTLQGERQVVIVLVCSRGMLQNVLQQGGVGDHSLNGEVEIMQEIVCIGQIALRLLKPHHELLLATHSLIGSRRSVPVLVVLRVQLT